MTRRRPVPVVAALLGQLDQHALGFPSRRLLIWLPKRDLGKGGFIPVPAARMPEVHHPSNRLRRARRGRRPALESFEQMAHVSQRHDLDVPSHLAVRAAVDDRLVPDPRQYLGHPFDSAEYSRVQSSHRT